MRVYLDYQIWDYISKNDDIKKYFEKQKVDKKWSYYITAPFLCKDFLYLIYCALHRKILGCCRTLDSHHHTPQ